MPRTRVRFELDKDERVPSRLRLSGLQRVVVSTSNYDATKDNGNPIKDVYGKIRKLVPGLTLPSDESSEKASLPIVLYRCFLVVLSMIFARFNPTSQLNEMQPHEMMSLWTHIGTEVCNAHPNRMLCIIPKVAKPLSQASTCRLVVERKKNKNNYYIMHIGYDASSNYVNIDVHRLICWMEHGNPPSPPAGERGPMHVVAMHLCHTKACINPFHIVWGTASTNLDDSKEFVKKKKGAFRKRTSR